NGKWCSDPVEVKEIFKNHFQTRFEQPTRSRFKINFQFNKCLSTDQSMDLDSMISREEIRKAVWSCGVNKSPGPDGFSFEFFHLWSKNEHNDEETDEDDDDDDDMDFTKQDFRSQCSLCAKEINWFHRYYAHLNCATARHEPFMSILISPGMGKLLKNFKDDDYPHLVHLPFPDQTMNLIKHLFSKEIGSGRSETNEARQTHICHQHPLILVDTTEPTTSTLSCHNPMKKVELICNGCLRPIMDSPFYTCADENEHHCNFALHAWCTRLPSEIKDYPDNPSPPSTAAVDLPTTTTCCRLLASSTMGQLTICDETKLPLWR
nr:DC1, C1-like, zinc finger, RING/FYVE/PHD-type [Tanacetum cinerariifolium]